MDNKNNEINSARPEKKKSGGLYRNVNISVKTANAFVAFGSAALLLVIFFTVLLS
ncbi:MAG: hypothetical protein LUG21_01280 [Clostridiales bacterium]|nr:hypothetical protein [Clostridiales bacterium]